MKKRGRVNTNSKAQTTIFIIIAVVIVAVVAGVVYLNQVSKQTELQEVFTKLGITEQVSTVESSILNCLDETAESSLIVIGIQGGFYNEPEKFFDLGWAIIPYYYDNGEFLKPSTDTIESELSVYIDDNARYCFESLEYENFDLAYKASETKTEIKKGEVSFKTDLSLTISKSDLTSDFKLKKHPVVIESSLYDILEVADYITESHKEDPEMICINCVADMAEIRNLYVDMIDFGDDETTTLTVISENYTSSEPYIFEFLNKYPITDIEIPPAP